MLRAIISASIIANSVDNLVKKVADITNYELVTESSTRSSHGKSSTTSHTSLRRKPAPAEPAKEEIWLVQPCGWEPRVGKRADGLKELWGAPRISKHGEIEVPVKLVDDDIVVHEYELALTSTVKGNLEICRRMATAALIKGNSAYITTDIYRAGKLLSHHAWDEKWIELRDIINELITELNYIAEMSHDARKAARKQGRQQLCADYGTTEEELSKRAGF